jgi:hypothetical protein
MDTDGEPMGDPLITNEASKIKRCQSALSCCRSLCPSGQAPKPLALLI